MGKRMRTICVAFGLPLAISGAASAAITVVDVVDSSSGQPGTYFLPPATDPLTLPYYRYADEDWGWTHSFCPLPASVISATLAIDAFDVDRGAPPDGEWNRIYLDGVFLGRLDTDYNSAWHTTTFNLNPDALARLMDGTAVISMDIDWLESPAIWAVTLRQSTLTAEIRPIPAPGALMLSCLGAGLTSYLRRRRVL